MNDSVLSLKENTTQERFTYIQIARKYFKYFMTYQVLFCMIFV